jgi:hypothetical protein
METAGRPVSGTVCRSDGFEFVVLNGRVIYCQTYDPTCPLESCEGVLTMPGNQARLLTGLIMGENITVEPLTVCGTYCVARTGNIYNRVYYEEFINTTQNGVVIIANRGTQNCVSNPIARITVDSAAFPETFTVDAISDVHHLLDGTVVYKACNSFHQTLTKYKSVRQINEYSIELDGIHMHSTDLILCNSLTNAWIDVRRCIQQLVNATITSENTWCIVKYGEKNIAFLEIPEHASASVWVAEKMDGHYLMLIKYRSQAFVGDEIKISTSRFTKPALRKAYSDDDE